MRPSVKMNNVFYVGFISRWVASVAVVLRQRFGFLATTTAFSYDGIGRHVRVLPRLTNVLAGLVRTFTRLVEPFSRGSLPQKVKV